MMPIGPGYRAMLSMLCASALVFPSAGENETPLVAAASRKRPGAKSSKERHGANKERTRRLRRRNRKQGGGTDG